MEGDAAIIQRMRSGEPDLFEVLVDRHRPTLVTRAFRFTRDRQLAEDLAQDAFLRAYQCLDQLENPERFGPWVRRILDSRCLMWVRASASRPSTAPFAALEERDLPDPKTASPESLLLRRELRRVVADICDCLPAPLRTTAHLFYVNGLSCGEIAAALSSSTATVESRLHKARAAIRWMVAGRGRSQRQRRLADFMLALIEEGFVMDAIRIEISSRCIPFVHDEGTTKGMITLVRELRAELGSAHALRVPKVRIRDNAALSGSSFSVFIREQNVATGTIDGDGDLAGFTDTLRRTLMDHRQAVGARQGVSRARVE